MDKKEWKQAKKAYKKAKHRAIRPWKGMSIFSAIFAVVFIAVFVICSTFDNTLAAFTGGTFWKLENEDADAQYFTSDFDKVEDNVAYGTDLCQRVEAEGAALLMNENDALPLKEGAKVSTFSNSSVNIVYGGTGSGNIDASSADTWKDALESAGFSVNKKLWDFYESGDGAEYASDRGGTVTTAGATTSEVPWKVYTDDVKKSVEKYGDAALVMISRVGGEGADATYDKSNYLALDDNEKEAIEHLILQMEKERGIDRSAAIADMRFTFIEKVCEQTVVKPKESKERIRSQKIDRILTGKYTAIPCFFGIMLLVFYLTFNVIGAWLQNLLELGISQLSDATEQLMIAADVNEVLRGLVIDGIFTGVGSVLSFLPIIVTLFFFLSLMEDSGYIARVAFVMDKLLRKIGLSGRSIVPMLLGFGCTVPALMSTRTLPSERDRKMPSLLTPFMSCSAKLPIYSFLISAFFPGHGALIMMGLYILGIAVGILVALVYRKTLFKGEAVPFVMELPNYRLPGAKNVLQLLWEKAKDFIQKAFTVIFMATICIWFLRSFSPHFSLVQDSKDSILAMIASVLVPIFKPLGLGDWRICVSLISGFMAKESVVSTLEVLFGGAMQQFMTPLAAMCLLVFSLLYTPCIAAIASIRRELGRKWAWGVVIWQCVIAWLVAYAVNLIGGFILG